MALHSPPSQKKPAKSPSSPSSPFGFIESPLLFHLFPLNPPFPLHPHSFSLRHSFTMSTIEQEKSTGPSETFPPSPAPVVVDVQRFAQTMMTPTTDTRNPMGIAMGPDGATRPFSHALFGCLDIPMMCVMSWFCPCIVYGEFFYWVEKRGFGTRADQFGWIARRNQDQVRRF